MFWAYPRVRGGTRGKSTSSLTSMGLSPRPRGNRKVAGIPSGMAGPIPASAGEPIAHTSPHRRAGAYPRVRGGTGRLGFRNLRSEGLSPRPRGNLRNAQGTAAHQGPIPASAGEPWAGKHRRPDRGAYPRVRGGTSKAAPASSFALGLSPRPRGNQILWDANSLRCGPIPASAGEPMLHAAETGHRRAYPRVRGGTHAFGPRAYFAWGLSPRPRGNRRPFRARCPGRGPIPASAGEPVLR